MIANWQKPWTISIHESLFELWGKRSGLFCFVLFHLVKVKFMEKLMCICYRIILQTRRLKCFELAPGVHSTNLGLAPKNSLCSSSLQSSSQKEKPNSSRTGLRPRHLLSRFGIISMTLLAKIIWPNLIQKVPYLPLFLSKNPLVPFSPVMMCKLTNNFPCGCHIWTSRM